MKRHLLLIAMICCVFQFPGISYSTPAGNLRISASGNASAEPKGGWFTGLGKRGTTYTMTPALISNLMDSNSNDLILSFDTIFISGKVVIDRSKITKNQYLTLRANDYTTGAIVFEKGASLTIKCATGCQSEIALACANITGDPSVAADQVVLSNVTNAYERIEMNGFKNWKQWQLDTLLAHADKVGPDIGDGAYDFTNSTLFTIDKNHVFSMTAQKDFLNGQKMGFKNMDRGGTLLPDEYSLGAYPDSFYVDLTKAEGIRFKVEVKGSAQSFNIGLSNCLKKGQWHEYCFEYYVYDIPFSAVDKDGYVTLPFSMFEKVSWGGTWDLSKLIVFIMEVKNVTKGTVVSFSDVHGYTSTIKDNPEMMVGNMRVTGNLFFSAANANIHQHPGTAVYAQSSRIITTGNVLLPNEGNYFGKTVDITASYAYLRYTAATFPATHTFSVSEMARYTLDQVWGDNLPKGKVYSLQQQVTNGLPHTYEAAFNNAYASLTAGHDWSLCHSEKLDVVAKSSAAKPQYRWYDGQGGLLSGSDTLHFPAGRPEGRYRYFVETETVSGNNTYNIMRGVVVDVWPEYDTVESLTICAASFPLKWRDTTFQAGTASGSYRLSRHTTHGCDSIMTLHLTVNHESYTALTDTLCEGEAYQKYGFDIAAEMTVGQSSLADTLVTSNVAGCDSTVTLLLTIHPKSATELYDTVKKGESYKENGFDVTGSELGDKDYELVLTNRFGCDSIVTLHLTTIINDGISTYDIRKAFAIYPNPAKEKLFFEQKSGVQATSLRLTDIRGGLLLQVPVNAERSELSLETLASGIYFLGVYQGEQLLGVFKVSKE